MFGGYEGGGDFEDAIDRHNRQERQRKREGFVPEPHPDANGSLGSKIAQMNRETSMTDPNKPRQQWKDHEVETMAAIHGLTIPIPYQKGETWYVKLAGAGSLATVVIIDVTDKTVELKMLPYGGTNRYIKTEITFVEKAR